MTAPLDRRLNAFRPDLADRRLKGRVEASHFVDGTPATVAVPVADLLPRPDPMAGLDTQLLRGERVNVFDSRDGWSWVQAEADSYVGYLPDSAVTKAASPATHIVIQPRTFLYPGPDMKLPRAGALSMGSLIRVVGEAETRGTAFAMLDDGTAIVARHLAAVGTVSGDYVSHAERLIETPYLWGGRSGFGIDCSGLVQLTMGLGGQAAPRDTDMQVASLGEPVAEDALQRGDLVFWKGHVAIVAGGGEIIHASGHQMQVVREPLEEAVRRIERLYGRPTLCRRPAPTAGR